MQSVMILGRQPSLGLAELESLYGGNKLQPLGESAVIVDVDPCLLAFDRLGGSIKFSKLLTILDTTNWQQIEKFLLNVSAGHSQRMPEGKMTLGLSLYGFDVPLKQIEATGLKIKKVIRSTGRPVRLVPNKNAELNTAQVTHNGLVDERGWELVFIKHGSETVVAQTVKVQDIGSYTRRDRERPKRDTRVGMLPPKLAQIIVNLGAGKLPESALESICEIPAGEPVPRKLLGLTVLDPFCGTGVVLQEAALMGYAAIGSDIDERMVSYSKANLEWLSEVYGESLQPVSIDQGDATDYNWETAFDFVATETYLGRPFTAVPDAETMAKNMADCNLIIKKFLQNLHEQVKPGLRLCIAVPAWQIKPNQFKFLPLIDQIGDLGYNRVRFEHTRDDQLLYYREDQIVARQLVVITRK